MTISREWEIEKLIGSGSIWDGRIVIIWKPFRMVVCTYMYMLWVGQDEEEEVLSSAAASHSHLHFWHC